MHAVPLLLPLAITLVGCTGGPTPEEQTLADPPPDGRPNESPMDVGLPSAAPDGPLKAAVRVKVLPEIRACALQTTGQVRAAHFAVTLDILGGRPMVRSVEGPLADERPALSPCIVQSLARVSLPNAPDTSGIYLPFVLADPR